MFHTFTVKRTPKISQKTPIKIIKILKIPTRACLCLTSIEQSTKHLCRRYKLFKGDKLTANMYGSLFSEII